jgi:hypothetical protein
MPKEKTTTLAETRVFKFHVIADVTLPVLKQQDGVPMYILIEAPIYKGETMNDKDGKAMEPADLAKCINLETGEVGVVVMNTVLKSSLERNYLENGYVGKCFRFERQAVPNKRYKNYKIQEISVG